MPGVRSLRGDRGSGSVLALAVVATVLTLGIVVVTLGSALAARQRVVAAADAAALAAADTLLGAVPGQPCERARQLAAAHRTSLLHCRLDGAEATVEVAGVAFGVSITARSRAGPAG